MAIRTASSPLYILSRQHLNPFIPLLRSFSTYPTFSSPSVSPFPLPFSPNTFTTQGFHFEVLTPNAIARLRERDSELVRSKEKLKRTVADNERLRARALASKTQAREQALKRLAKDVLDVKDELEMAIRGARTYINSLSSEGEKRGEEEEEGRRREQMVLESLCQGVELSHKALMLTLRRYGIEKMEPLGDKFDPELHQGLQELEDSSKAPGTVAAVLKDGYTLRGSVLRTAEVSITKEPTA